jgi:ketosteroid isomerase-like protein
MSADASGPLDVVARLHEALNAHDIRAFVECFDPDYRSEQPAHPNRGFGGRAQVEENWSAMFAGIPDIHAELLGTAIDGPTAWVEWRWSGTRADAPPLDMRGVTLFRVENGRITAARLYMEEVEAAGASIDETVRHLTEG